MADQEVPWVVIHFPPVDDDTPPAQRLAVLVLADALDGEDVVWPAEFAEGWDVLEHLAAQIPGARVVIELPVGGRITRDPRSRRVVSDG